MSDRENVRKVIEVFLAQYPELVQAVKDAEGARARERAKKDCQGKFWEVTLQAKPFLGYNDRFCALVGDLFPEELVKRAPA